MGAFDDLPDEKLQKKVTDPALLAQLNETEAAPLTTPGETANSIYRTIIRPEPAVAAPAPAPRTLMEQSSVDVPPPASAPERVLSPTGGPLTKARAIVQATTAQQEPNDFDENLFREWYAWFAGRAWDGHLDPDHLGHAYDWRRAFRDGVNPSWDKGKNAYILPDTYLRDPGWFIDLAPKEPKGPLQQNPSIWEEGIHYDIMKRKRTGNWRKGNKI